MDFEFVRARSPEDSVFGVLSDFFGEWAADSDFFEEVVFEAAVFVGWVCGVGVGVLVLVAFGGGVGEDEMG